MGLLPRKAIALILPRPPTAAACFVVRRPMAGWGSLCVAHSGWQRGRRGLSSKEHDEVAYVQSMHAHHSKMANGGLLNL